VHVRYQYSASYFLAGAVEDVVYGHSGRQAANQGLVRGDAKDAL
jgi:hypothetical protein